LLVAAELLFQLGDNISKIRTNLIPINPDRNSSHAALSGQT